MDIRSLTAVQKNRLNLSLRPVFIGQLLFIDTLENPAFHYNNGTFEIVIEANEGITPHFVTQYAKKYSREIFIYYEDYISLSSKLKNDLTKLTRSLSIGDVKKNGIKHTNLLSMQMGNLYKDPFNDELLTSQFQNSKNLGTLLLNHKDIQRSIYQNISKSHYHFTLTQPLLSSLLLLGFFQSIKLFNDKEIEGLFLTSYFKDIGMSFIPREKFELSHLSEFDKKLFAEHADNSMQILDGRAPLTQTQLNLIKNHHYLNYKLQSLAKNKKVKNSDEFITGIESTFISAMDILTAMIHPRPYRDAVAGFQALELLKKVIADDYPHEFRALVFFLKNFLSK